jgi:hypothetical protein
MPQLSHTSDAYSITVASRGASRSAASTSASARRFSSGGSSAKELITRWLSTKPSTTWAVALPGSSASACSSHWIASADASRV